MARARLLTALLGLGLSLAVSLVAWVYFDVAFLLFFVPFVPFLFGRDAEQNRDVRECPVCEFQTDDDAHEYCPRDGHRLEKRGKRE